MFGRKLSWCKTQRKYACVPLHRLSPLWAPSPLLLLCNYSMKTGGNASMKEMLFLNTAPDKLDIEQDTEILARIHTQNWAWSYWEMINCRFLFNKILFHHHLL